MSNPFLTLPPAVGNRYLYRGTKKEDDGLHECEILRESTNDGKRTWITQRWTYWDDGKAHLGNPKNNEYVAILVEDVLIPGVKSSASEELKNLRTKREEMMNRLKELGA